MAIPSILDNLKDGGSPNLELVHPTEAEKQIQFNANANEWRGALSKPAYFRREATLSQTTLTRDGGISYWILADPDKTVSEDPWNPDSGTKLPKGTRLPLASCETIRKKALVWQNGELKEVICHGVGSVFCPEPLRRKKKKPEQTKGTSYASRMLTELGERLKTYQTEDGQECLFSILYSDIGPVSSSDIPKLYIAKKDRTTTQSSAGKDLRRHMSLSPRAHLKTRAAYLPLSHCTRRTWRNYARSTKPFSAGA